MLRDFIYTGFILVTLIAITLLARVAWRSRLTWLLAQKKKRPSAPHLKGIWLLTTAIIVNFCFWPFVIVIGPRVLHIGSSPGYLLALFVVISAAELGLAIVITQWWNKLEKGNSNGKR